MALTRRLSFVVLCLLSEVLSAWQRPVLSPVRRRPLMSKTEMEEEEAKIMRDAEKIAKKKRSNMFNENGVAYAPWMVRQVDEEAITVARALRAEKKRKDRQSLMEAQGMVNILEAATSELSGMGLKAKVLSEDEVELVWGTDNEDDTVGFIVEKKRIGGSEWVELASFKDWAPLKSKGVFGGAYTYTDVEAEEGEFLYRVVSQETDGTRTITCQVGITVESGGQQLQTKIIVGVSIALFASFLAIGATLDPIAG